MLFLSWTVIPETLVKSSSVDKNESGLRNVSSERKRKNSSNIDENESQLIYQRLIKSRAKVHDYSGETFWADSEDIFDNDAEDLDPSSTQSLEFLQNAMLEPVPHPQGRLLSPSQQNQKSQIAGNGRTTMVIPLRGRSQSSYSNFDISATVTRRKGSADDIIVNSSTGLSIRSSDFDGTAPNSLTPTLSLSQSQQLGQSIFANMDHKQVIKKGRLFKLGLSKRLTGEKSPVWKQRDFVLSGYYLSYLDSMKRRNEFDLRGCSVTCMIAHKGSGLSVDLHAMSISSFNGNRRIVLGGSSEVHRDEWVECIEQQLHKISLVEEELDGEVEEARFKGIPSPLEQILLNPPPPTQRKRTASSAINLLALTEIDKLGTQKEKTHILKLDGESTPT